MPPRAPTVRFGALGLAALATLATLAWRSARADVPARGTSARNPAPDAGALPDRDAGITPRDIITLQGEPPPDERALRIVAPRAGAWSGVRRPAFRFRAPAGAGTARFVLDLCRDRACASVLETVETSGDRAAPTRDLPAGAVFARVRDASGATPASAPLRVVVSARAAAGSSGTVGTFDVNRDGFDDLVVLDRADPAALDVYLGARTGLPAQPSQRVVLAPPASTATALRVVAARDLDGDGFADVVLSRNDPGASSVGVYRGGAAGLTPSTVIHQEHPADAALSWTVAGVDDFDADGFADLWILEESGGDPVVQRWRVYRGSASGPVPTARVFPVPADVTDAAAGDFDADGAADLVVLRAGVLALVPGASLGGVGPLALRPWPEVITPQGERMAAHSLAVVGDLDGDGLLDVATWWTDSSESSGTAVVALHTRGASAAAYARTRHYGRPAVAGDTDGDGFDDLLFNGALLHGGAAGPIAAATPMCAHSGGTCCAVRAGAGQAPDANFTEDARGGAGDLDGDGFADVVTRGPCDGEHDALVVTFGSPRGPDTARRATLVRRGFEPAHFGQAVAVVRDRGGPVRFAIGAPGAGRVALVTWRAGTGPYARPYEGFLEDAGTLSAPTPGDRAFGAALLAADLDGDGQSELLVGAPGAREGRGRVFLYRAAHGVFAPAPALTLESPAGVNHGFGERLFALGDLDHDGVPEWAVTSDDPACVRVYSSARPGAARFERCGAAGERFGAFVVPWRDLDGDGTDDILVGAPGALGGRGVVRAVSLRAGASPGVDLFVLSAPGTRGLGASLAEVSDLDGDGAPELLVGSDGPAGAAPGAYWFALARGRRASAHAVERPERGRGAGYGTAVAGDGARAWIAAPADSAVYPHAGGARTGLAPGVAVFVRPGGGVALRAAGDVDGDGAGECLVGAGDAAGGAGYAALLYGGVSRLRDEIGNHDRGDYGASIAGAHCE